MEFVSVKSENTIMEISVTNNKIKLKSLKSYFGENAAGLTFQRNEKKCCLDVGDDDTLSLVPKINNYEVFYGSSKKCVANSEALSQRKAEMLALIGNEPMAHHKVPHVVRKAPVKKISTKTIHIGWLIMRNNKYILQHGLTHLKLLLYENVEYTFGEVKNMCINLLKDGSSSYFEDCIIKLGGFKQKFMCEHHFSNSIGKKCDFWEYAPLIRGLNNQYRLYVYTEKKNNHEIFGESIDNSNSASSHQEAKPQDQTDHLSPHNDIVKKQMLDNVLETSQDLQLQEVTPTCIRLSYLRKQFPAFGEEHSESNLKENLGSAIDKKG